MIESNAPEWSTELDDSEKLLVYMDCGTCEVEGPLCVKKLGDSLVILLEDYDSIIEAFNWAEVIRVEIKEKKPKLKPKKKAGTRSGKAKAKTK